ncbi:hypothetical protein ABZ319_17400 [Nocardia sp. NPDC005978]|uniref:hypothetical protein n=1 Tax=Nocardia sp. NPDC005978 TaxID=3156725 RepID=UPI0033BA1D43
MTLTSRTLRAGAAVVALTAGLIAAAGPATAASPPGSGSSTGSKELLQSAYEVFVCTIGPELFCDVINGPVG